MEHRTILSLNDPHRIKKPSAPYDQNDVRSTFHCRECNELYWNDLKPITMLVCGHSICSVCLELFDGSSYTCKACNQVFPLNKSQTRENFILEALVEELSGDNYLRMSLLQRSQRATDQHYFLDDEDDSRDPINELSVKAELKVKQLDTISKIITKAKGSGPVSKTIQKTEKAVKEEFNKLADGVERLELDNVASHLRDVYYLMKPTEAKLEELRQQLKKDSKYADLRKKFFKAFNHQIELQFDLEYTKDVQDMGIKLFTSVEVNSRTLWAQMEWHEIGFHLHSFKESAAKEMHFYHQYNSISETVGLFPYLVFFDLSMPVPEKEANSGNYLLARDEIASDPSPESTPDEPTDSTQTENSPDELIPSSEDQPAEQPVEEPVEQPGERPVWRQRVYVTLAESCHANHFAEMAIGCNGTSYKGLELHLEADGKVLVSKREATISRPLIYTSQHRTVKKNDGKPRNVFSLEPNMSSSMFKIVLKDHEEQSGHIGLIRSGMDFLNKITSSATVEDCGVVLKKVATNS